VPGDGRKLDIGVVGPDANRLAECSVLVSVVVASTDAGEPRNGVAELLNADGVAAGPPTPGVECFDLVA
jgi:hypothetical protein